MNNEFTDLEIAAIQLALQDQLHSTSSILESNKKDDVLNDYAVSRGTALLNATSSALLKTIEIFGTYVPLQENITEEEIKQFLK